MQDSVQQRGRVQQPAPHLRLLTWQGSDAELLDLVAMNDASAALRFHDRFGNDVHALVRVLVGPDRAHARLVEQSLLAALASLYRRSRSTRSSYSREPNGCGLSVGMLPAWVERHTVKVVRAHLRRQYWFRRFGGRAPRVESGVSDQVLVFYERLAHLAPDLRLVFCLRYVAGRALSDTARLCQCTVSEARSRLEQAEAHLRTTAEDDFGSDMPEFGWES